MFFSCATWSGFSIAHGSADSSGPPGSVLAGAVGVIDGASWPPGRCAATCGMAVLASSHDFSIGGSETLTYANDLSPKRAYSTQSSERSDGYCRQLKPAICCGSPFGTAPAMYSLKSMS